MRRLRTLNSFGRIGIGGQPWGWKGGGGDVGVVPCPLVDTFTDADGTLLSAHAPNVNEFAGIYASFASGGPLPIGDIQGNRARIQDNGDGNTRGFEIECGIADGILVLETFTNAIAGGWLGLCFRSDGLTRWTARHESTFNRAVLFDPDGILVDNQALVINPTDQIDLILTLAGTSVSCIVRNVTTAVQVTVATVSAKNLAATIHGITIRTVFGAGAGDFF